jgi:hypothetical protein
VNKFQHLFTEETVEFPFDLEILIAPSISAEENQSICMTPTPKEIKDVIFGMKNLKAPGSDGLPILFYKQYWPTVGDPVIKAIQGFFTSGHLLSKVNNSLIVLILKNNCPTSVNHF